MKAAYGKEPLDLKLIVLRLMVQLPRILMWMALSVVVLFGSYCLKSYVFHGPVTYSGASTFRVEYTDRDWAQNLTYINFATWDTYLSSDAFQEILAKYMDEELLGLPAEERKSMFSADVPSDLRVVVITTESENEELVRKMAEALEEALVAEFPAFCPDVTEVKLLEAATVGQTFRDIRLLRALILSLVVAVIFVLLIFLIGELGCDDIFLPGTFTGRFGIKSLGADSDGTLESNLKAVFAGRRVAVLPVSGTTDTTLLENALKAAGNGDPSMVTVLPAPTLCPDALKEAAKDGEILLAVPCERGNSGELAYALELLAMRDLKPAAAVLTDGDQWLLDRYYGR